MLTRPTEPVIEPALHLPSPHQASANQSWCQTHTGPGHRQQAPLLSGCSSQKQVILHSQEKHKISPHIKQPIPSWIFPSHFFRELKKALPAQESPKRGLNSDSVSSEAQTPTQGWQTRHRAFSSPAPFQKGSWSLGQTCRPLTIHHTQSPGLRLNSSTLPEGLSSSFKYSLVNAGFSFSLQQMF